MNGKAHDCELTPLFQLDPLVQSSFFGFLGAKNSAVFIPPFYFDRACDLHTVHNCVLFIKSFKKTHDSCDNF